MEKETIMFTITEMKQRLDKAREMIIVLGDSL